MGDRCLLKTELSRQAEINAPHTISEKNCHSREGGNPQPIGGERKVQLIMFTYLLL